MNAGRLPFGVPSINAAKEFGNGNYLWISYFYAYLNEKGRAGFVMASSATDSSGKDRDIRQKLVETGHVDVMMSVGNNFFYTKSLPCSIWFFDKGKAEAIQDHVLFIDARSYYTVVDRTLNEWSEWQLKNLNAIVWLYRGEQDKYKKLLEEYDSATRQMAGVIAQKQYSSVLNFINKQVYEKNKSHSAASKVNELYTNIFWIMEHLLGHFSGANEEELDNCIIIEKSILEYKRAAEMLIVDVDLHGAACMGMKTTIKTPKQKQQKELLRILNEQTTDILAVIDEYKTCLREAMWLKEKFGNNGEYHDIPGLCKKAKRSEIAEKNYSLTPGAYVGVAAVEDDGVDFAQRMVEIHRELLKLQAESNELMQTISKNMEGLL
jgi:type I restriction enzyme M protein